MSPWVKFCSAAFAVTFGWNVGAAWIQDAPSRFGRAGAVLPAPFSSWPAVGRQATNLQTAALTAPVRTGAAVRGAEPASFGAPSVGPVLKQYCVSCHGGKETRSGFDLTTREGLLKGGDGGVAVRPGRAAESPMVAYLAHREERLEHSSRQSSKPTRLD